MNLGSYGKIDRHLVTPTLMELLLGTCDEMDEWAPELASKLEMDVKTLKELFDELRIFFTLASIAINSHVQIPGHEIYQPPPQIERLWRVMCADERMVGKFIAVTYLDDRFRFQDPYPEVRRISPARAHSLMSLGKLAGLPVNEKYWAF